MCFQPLKYTLRSFTIGTSSPSQMIPGTKIIALGSYLGPDGGNAFLDFKDLPFVPKRMYIVHGVRERITRGNHAHRDYSQFLIASAGSCRVLLDDTEHQDEILLTGPSEGLFVPPAIWTVVTDFAPGTALTVLSSGSYDRAEFINSKEELAAFRGQRHPAVGDG